MKHDKQFTFGVLFAGLGGLSRGFLDAGLAQAFAVDFDAAACRDHETICGEAATVADLATMTPDELRALSPVRPDVLVSSPPCVAFSGCLPQAQSVTPEYMAISSLAFRGIRIALEAWQDSPPPLIIIENVPRITTRGREWLDCLKELFDAFGYAWRETTHDCGEIGGLAQRRRRFLGVARHRAQVPEYLFEPNKTTHRSIGDVIGDLPIPLPKSAAGGRLHALQRLSPLNWARLAAILAGHDWRTLPERIALTCEPRSGVYGVNAWDGVSGTVVGEARVDNGMWACADPRIEATRREGSLGITAWDGQTHAVIGSASIQNTALSTADPRVAFQERAGAYGVDAWDGQAGTVIGEARSYQGANVADVRDVVGDFDSLPAEGLGSRKPCHMLIRAEDDTWHRPLTTLELAALQGFDVGDDERGWLQLDGKSEAAWRKRIGNAVPPPAAMSIAKSCLRTLIACAAGGLLLSGEDVTVWVKGRHYEARW